MYAEDTDVIQYDKIRYINPITLISEVKKYPALYNSDAAGYENRPMKEKIWESIHCVLIENYKELNDETRAVIKETVRGRWKTLRAGLVKDFRLRKENPAYCKTRMTPRVKEMQFLIPFVKNLQRPQPQSSNGTIDGKISPDSSNSVSDSTIDLTMQEDSCVQVGAEEVDLRNGICVSASNNNSTLKYTIREVGETEMKATDKTNTRSYEIEIKTEATQKNTEKRKLSAVESGTKVAAQTIEIKAEETESPVLKRKRADSEDDLDSKLRELIDRYKEESQDEDRMFLMSLLSDFKRVPDQKKLKVKSSIISCLLQAID